MVIGITLRGKQADSFWFSLFHELGHILLGHLTKGELNDSDEIEAGEFAREVLLNREVYNKFINNTRITKDLVINFAKEQGIHKGIVVGRLESDKVIPYTHFNELKVTYDYKE